MTQSRPSIYRQILALMGQVQLRQERLEAKLDGVMINVQYLRNRTHVEDEGNLVAMRHGEPLFKADTKNDGRAFPEQESDVTRRQRGV